MPFRHTILLAAVALLAGCASVPRVAPGVRPVAAGDLGLSSAEAPEIASDWWTGLGDPGLDRVMTEALAGSPTLAEAAARIRQAEAAVAVTGAANRPQITLDASEQRQRLSERYIIPPQFGGTSLWIGSILANFSWSLDLAGRQAALVAQAQASANAARLDAAAARITLAGSIAQTWANLARAEAQIAVARDFIASREEGLRLTRVRIRSGLSSNFDIRAAEVTLTDARQAALRAEGDRVLLRNALAALAGRGADYPATLPPPVVRFDAALPMPQAVPADLLGRRPDILAARARVEAAEAGRRSARAAFYPNLDLRGFLGTQAIGIGNLFEPGALVAGAGPALSLPIFEGGRLAGNYRGAVAAIDVGVAQYNELVLRAVREAADALAAAGVAAADADQQRAKSASLAETVRLDQTRLRTGLGSRLDALASADRLLAARLDQTNLDADALLRRIQLVVALGGGFVPPPAPVEGSR